MCEFAEAPSPLPGLSQDEFFVWSGFNLVYASIARHLDATLRETYGLPLSDCEILLWISRPSCHHIRLAALAEQVRLSPSGLSRAIERLESRGLVHRLRSEDDRRGAFAELTPAGASFTAQVAATLAEGVRTEMLAAMTPAEMATFRQVWQRLLTRGDLACPLTHVQLSEETS